MVQQAKKKGEKAICFVTGVPGAGKTLVGLDVATKHLENNDGLASVFLSGNGPLVSILREALTRDKVKREKAKGFPMMGERKVDFENSLNSGGNCGRSEKHQGGEGDPRITEATRSHENRGGDGECDDGEQLVGDAEHRPDGLNGISK